MQKTKKGKKNAAEGLETENTDRTANRKKSALGALSPSGTAVIDRPSQHVGPFELGRRFASRFIPGTSILPRPPQHRQMPALCCL